MTTPLYKQWIEALESDNYSPGHSALKNFRNSTNQPVFCCLGVACDISALGKWDADAYVNYYRTDDLREDLYEVLTAGDPEVPEPAESYLPVKIADALGIGSTDGSFDFTELSTDLQEELRDMLHFDTKERHTPHSLADINDNVDTDKAFYIIARILREEPPSLFYAHH